MSMIGKDIRLEDGGHKVQGQLKFGADLVRHGQLVARMVTSPYAHALIDNIDTSDAIALAGVHAVLTASDLPPAAAQSRSTLLLASDRVRFVGHPVALVLAENEAIAQDAADLVLVDYTPQEHVVTLDAAMTPGAAPVWPEGMPGASAEAAAHGASAAAASDEEQASSNVAGESEFTRGDLDKGFAEASHIVERTYRTAGVHQGYIEPHVTLAEMDPSGESVSVWTSTQATFFVRDAVASVLNLPASSVRVVGTPVGGGFGAKFCLYEPLVALAARHIGRPVMMTMNRMEEMVTATPAPATRVTVRLGATSDGRFTALDAELVMDCGCFPGSMSILGPMLLGSSYQTPNQRVRGVEVLTNRPSTGAYRAPAAPQCAFAIESAIDEMATALQLDPVAVRVQNASKSGQPMAMGNPWPVMGLPEVLDAMSRHPLWLNREEARAQGRGIGVAVGGWPGGIEPAAAACSLQGDGVLQVQISSVDLTGTRTAFQQIAAETFGIEPDQIRIISGDTQAGPFAGSTGGSKITYTVGPAIIDAVAEVKEQVLELAGTVLEAAPEDLEISNGAVQVKGAPQSAIPLAKLARKTMSYGSTHKPLYGQGRNAQPGQAPGYCAQLAEVSVDPDTGAVTVHKLLLIQDVGKAINPLLVRGQMQGGAMQGLGWALCEELCTNDDGQTVTATFSDYALPHFSALPETFLMEIVEVPAPTGPFGAKGVGEPPVIATAAAVANAVADATGARIATLPLSAPNVLAELLSSD